MQTASKTRNSGRGLGYLTVKQNALYMKRIDGSLLDTPGSALGAGACGFVERSKCFIALYLTVTKRGIIDSGDGWPKST